MRKAYSFFPGCSFESTGISYADSTKYVAGVLDMEFYEIKDWNCCGTSAAPTVNDDLMYALSGRNLALSEDQHPYLDLVTPCTGCYASLKRAEVWANQDEGNLVHLNKLINMNYRGTTTVRSLLEVMTDPAMVQEVVDHLKLQLGGMKVACYYGCGQVRPQSVTGAANAENPMMMETLLNAAGAQCVDWAFKTECCGASNHVIRPKAARSASERILHNAQANGAECIVTSCPLCWMNLDMREDKINQEHGTDYHLPIYYFTELIALALGATPEQAGITRHFVPATDFALGKLTDEPIAKPETEEEAKARRIAEAKARKAARDKQKAQAAAAESAAAPAAATTDGAAQTTAAQPETAPMKEVD